MQTSVGDTPISNIRLSILYANVETPRRGPTLSKGVTLSCGIDLEVYSGWQRVKQGSARNLFHSVHLYKPTSQLGARVLPERSNADSNLVCERYPNPIYRKTLDSNLAEWLSQALILESSAYRYFGWNLN